MTHKEEWTPIAIDQEPSFDAIQFSIGLQDVRATAPGQYAQSTFLHEAWNEATETDWLKRKDKVVPFEWCTQAPVTFAVL
ncbi:MAG: hypothetical protein M1817_000385 [Caeruleum heppii]|nr:MAG: hypothetical protein M1817_000385 [Caeruleum heppii]